MARATFATTILTSQSCGDFQAASAELGVGVGEDETDVAGGDGDGVDAAVVPDEDTGADVGGVTVDAAGVDVGADGAVVR